MFFDSRVLTSGHEEDLVEETSSSFTLNPALFDATSLFLEDETHELVHDLEGMKLDSVDGTAFPLSKEGNKTMKQLLKSVHDGLQNVIKFSILKPFKEFKNDEILNKIKDMGYVVAVTRYNEKLSHMKETYVPIFERMLIESLKKVLPNSPKPSGTNELDICFHWSVIVMWVCAELEHLFQSMIHVDNMDVEVLSSITTFKLYYETFLYEKNHKLSKSKATALFKKFKTEMNSKSFPTLSELSTQLVKMEISDTKPWAAILHAEMESELKKVTDKNKMLKELVEFDNAVKAIAVIYNLKPRKRFEWNNGLPVLSKSDRAGPAKARDEKTVGIVTDKLQNLPVQVKADSNKSKPTTMENIPKPKPKRG